ncbi:UPF0755 protein [Rhodoblastus acidophilus]|uniref:endolytic transglycosylase MltG n=1 Tax=Rhodoblastus acidophilus TaxID=1074 RepID=UPI0022258EF8|nr:endolytic transglycosylase MltG [Rhodoblastus acidophilus]MCW2282898.1 UPF0755 protein [Rhodoblastus acidophilus]MCW2331759.1 UPF0755 protein [Rhodoblastus acidophilus]
MSDDRQTGAAPSRLSRRGSDEARRAAAQSLTPEATPPLPKRRRRPGLLAAISGVLTFLLVAAVVAGLGIVMASRSARLPGPLTADKTVVIPPGSDADDISQILVDQGVIDNRLSFAVAMFVEGLRGKLKAGEYLFKQNASLQEVIDEIVQGRAILHALTIPEGLTSRQIVDKLREDQALAGDIREIPREGALLPETYKFQRGDSRDKLLQKMARDQKALVDEIWRRRSPDLTLSSPTEMVTLASIVEKETGKADERPHVASVFLNRLKKRMRLQSDPTVVYGLAPGQPYLGHSLTREDLESRTPYNTYVIDGLPPGPIANPGRAALEAVANPSRTADLYFVADGTGGHVFSETLDAHNKNVQRWRQLDPAKKRDNRSEWRRSPFGAPPIGPVEGARWTPSLKRDPGAVAHLAPGLPDSPPAPTRISDYEPARGAAPQLAGDVLADTPMGPVTRAENLLDGPADDLAPPPARATANMLDGPADAVDPAALAYSAEPQAAADKMAPNGKPRIYDASAGTALDPLLDKSWDLNSAKTVDLAPPSGKTK